MTYFVVLPGALVPASIADRLLARAEIPLLRRRLARGRVQSLQPTGADGAAHRRWLWQAFGGTGGAPVSAPYAWRALNQSSLIDVASESPLWHADPVHFAFARDHMLVAPLDGAAEVSSDEAAVLAEVAAGLAAEAGATLRVIGHRHWFLSFDPAWNLSTVALDAALGRSVEHVLPEGPDAARWRKLLTEIQMAWHQHAVNQARDDAGRPMINGLWLHGGGAWLPLAQRPFDLVFADDAIVRGWALAANVAPNNVQARASASALAPPASNVLVYDPALLAAAGSQDWDGWLACLARCDAPLDDLCARALAAGHAEVAFVLAGTTHARRVALARADRWAFWRRTRLDALFAEPEPA